MEYAPEIFERFHAKLDLFNPEVNEPCISSLSSDSDLTFRHVGLFPSMFHNELMGPVIQERPMKRDFLQRIFDKKKLKDKSLSKKMKTPFDRKLNRKSWPIRLNKISKIKDKPSEKKKEKPTNRSLKEKKFSNPNFASTAGNFARKVSSTHNSEADILDEDFVDEMLRDLKDSHYIYEPVTPQMLIDILKEPEHLVAGATADTIISKLRAWNYDFNPALEVFKNEVLHKLECAIKLNLIVEENGYYFLAETFRANKLSKKKLDAFWKLWYRKCKSLAY